MPCGGTTYSISIDRMFHVSYLPMSYVQLQSNDEATEVGHQLVSHTSNQLGTLAASALELMR